MSGMRAKENLGKAVEGELAAAGRGEAPHRAAVQLAIQRRSQVGEYDAILPHARQCMPVV